MSISTYANSLMRIQTPNLTCPIHFSKPHTNFTRNNNKMTNIKFLNAIHNHISRYVNKIGFVLRKRVYELMCIWVNEFIFVSYPHILIHPFIPQPSKLALFLSRRSWMRRRIGFVFNGHKMHKIPIFTCYKRD